MKTLLDKYNVQGPRYTSYPTAPVWQSDFPEQNYNESLQAFGKSDKTLSLYIHVPFCEKMCYYCGCSVIIRKKKPNVAENYITLLEKEMSILSKRIGRKPTLKQFHIGGGTPSFLTIEEMGTLIKAVHKYFNIAADAEVAIEIDPRRIDADYVKGLRKLGFNRLSMGLQDFNPDVQSAINRIQPYEVVEPIIKAAKEVQFDSINIDLIYGLPYQTPENILFTIDKITTLLPDRIAFYSYAHVPWLKEHQRLIDTSKIAEGKNKLQIFLNGRAALLKAGYLAIGMDHFALKTDDMATHFLNGTLYRNFMGYTLKPADEFIGIGVSSIGQLEGRFIQNTKDLNQYETALKNNTLPIEKGLQLSPDDQIRQYIIDTWMCQFKLEKSQIESKFNISFDRYFESEIKALGALEIDGLVSPTSTGWKATKEGQFFIRNICMCFDAYLKNTAHRFSKTV